MWDDRHSFGYLAGHAIEIAPCEPLAERPPARTQPVSAQADTRQNARQTRFQSHGILIGSSLEKLDWGKMKALHVFLPWTYATILKGNLTGLTQNAIKFCLVTQEQVGLLREVRLVGTLKQNFERKDSYFA